MVGQTRAVEVEAGHKVAAAVEAGIADCLEGSEERRSSGRWEAAPCEVGWPWMGGWWKEVKQAGLRVLREDENEMSATETRRGSATRSLRIAQRKVRSPRIYGYLVGASDVGVMEI